MPPITHPYGIWTGYTLPPTARVLPAPASLPVPRGLSGTFLLILVDSSRFWAVLERSLYIRVSKKYAALGGGSGK